VSETNARRTAPKGDPARLLADLQSLVAIPSVSGSEAALGEWLSRTLRRRGFRVTIQPVQKDRANVIARLRFGPGGKSLVFNGHLDTLPLQRGWRRKPYRAALQKSRVYGSEVNNMKAALAAYLEALRLLAQYRPVRRGEIVLTAVIGECDALGLGTLALLESGFRADAAILGEPTDLGILTGHAGVTQLRIVVRGHAAHISNPKAGRNAIVDMMHLLSGVDTRILHYRPDPAFPGLPTLNIGLMHGGTAASMMADRCEALVDVRTVPGMTPDSVRRDLQRYVSARRRRTPALSARVELRPRPEFCQQHPFQVDPAAPIVRAVAAAAAAVSGQRPRIGSWRPCVCYGTDASHLRRAGIPVAIYGPGSAAQVSRPDERIRWKDVLTAANVYYAAAVRFLGGED
jgi:acetylornithine deacetylase/succinyl-diaminopimelate desuccinylase-like protein